MSIAHEVNVKLLEHNSKDLLRFITCSNVDDGKSTLIGRLLLEAGAIYEDQIAALYDESKKHGTTGDRIDTALLLDGLEDERQQGITIDVAYRYFSTSNRKFIIADSPGHIAVVLDGQAMRMGISRDLAFSAEEQSENLRRAAEIAKMLNDAGQICIGAFFAPSAWVRRKTKSLVGADRFFHVHLSTNVEVYRQRDITGQYLAADRGEIASFPGVTFEYEIPDDADLVFDTSTIAATTVAWWIYDALQGRWLLGSESH